MSTIYYLFNRKTGKKLVEGSTQTVRDFILNNNIQKKDIKIKINAIELSLENFYKDHLEEDSPKPKPKSWFKRLFGEK